MFVCLLLLCNPTLLAQTGHPRIVHTTEKSVIHVPPQEAPAGLKKIFSNLGKSKTDLYNDAAGWNVEGPNSGQVTQFVGIPFTPKSNSHVSQVRVAMQYDGSGANQVNLSIYGDAGGMPGTLLTGPVTVTNLPDFGTCCALAVASFSPLAVTGGTQYWVVANTPPTGTGSDFVGVWVLVAAEYPLAVYEYGSWYPFIGDTIDLAGEVLGTMP